MNRNSNKQTNEQANNPSCTSQRFARRQLWQIFPASSKHVYRLGLQKLFEGTCLMRKHDIWVDPRRSPIQWISQQFILNERTTTLSHDSKPFAVPSRRRFRWISSYLKLSVTYLVKRTYPPAVAAAPMRAWDWRCWQQNLRGDKDKH